MSYYSVYHSDYYSDCEPDDDTSSSSVPEPEPEPRMSRVRELNVMTLPLGPNKVLVYVDPLRFLMGIPDNIVWYRHKNNHFYARPTNPKIFDKSKIYNYRFQVSFDYDHTSVYYICDKTTDILCAYVLSCKAWNDICASRSVRVSTVYDIGSGSAMKLPFTDKYSILIKKSTIENDRERVSTFGKKPLVNATSFDECDNPKHRKHHYGSCTDNQGVYIHGTGSEALEDIHNNGIDLLKKAKHGRKCGKGFYTSMRMDVAFGYASTYSKKGKHGTIIMFSVDTPVAPSHASHAPAYDIKKTFSEYVFRERYCTRKYIKVLYSIIYDPDNLVKMTVSKRRSYKNESN